VSDKLIFNVVASECRPADEEDFVKWYDEVHIPLLLKFKGLREVTRYELVEKGMRKQIHTTFKPEDNAKFLVFYGFEDKEAMAGFPDSPEVTAAQKEMKETWKDRKITIKWIAQYEPMRIWKK
jgi:hypothetical protein